jgi:hypothetical protein
MIVNLPSTIIESINKRYETHLEAFKYDSMLMEQIFNFGIKKKELLNKKK